MELSGLLVWAAVLVSLIAFIVFLVKGFKQWGVWMTIGFVVLFIECWTFLVITAGVNKARLEATKSFDQLFTERKKLLAQREEEFYGLPTNPAPDMQRYFPLASELNRVLLERGRTWRGARVISANPAGATIELPSALANLPSEVPPPDANGAAAPPAAPATSNSLAVESIVYVFGEDQQQIPVNYLGEFKVTGVNGPAITITPTTPLAQNQVGMVNQSATWAVYELIPLDSHTAFAQPGSQPTDDEIFGSMNPEELSRLLRIPLELTQRAPSDLNVFDSVKARALQSYILDGSKAPAGTPLENIVYEVKFLKDYTETVDSTDRRKPTEGGYFDASGRTVDVRLMREDSPDASFKAEEVYKIYGPRAKELEADGIVDLGTPYFVRPLNDYAFGFRETRRLTQQTMQDIALVNREIAVITQTEKNAREQLLRMEEIGRQMEKDQAQYAKELAVIQSEQQRLQSEIDSKKSDLGKVYATILDLHSKLVTVQSKIVNAVQTSSKSE
ncbi:MAG: hypothetical protein MUD03_03015 [Pirellula sp.]|jgi:hypothetical protein|nr:hypothetical protein [Pirellula sp.]